MQLESTGRLNGDFTKRIYHNIIHDEGFFRVDPHFRLLSFHILKWKMKSYCFATEPRGIPRLTQIRVYTASTA